jgi:hypothetical protein
MRYWQNLAPSEVRGGLRLCDALGQSWPNDRVGASRPSRRNEIGICPNRPPSARASHRCDGRERPNSQHKTHAFERIILRYRWHPLAAREAFLGPNRPDACRPRDPENWFDTVVSRA